MAATSGCTFCKTDRAQEVAPRRSEGGACQAGSCVAAQREMQAALQQLERDAAAQRRAALPPALLATAPCLPHLWYVRDGGAALALAAVPRAVAGAFC